MTRIFSFFKQTPQRVDAFSEGHATLSCRGMSHGHARLEIAGYKWSHNIDGQRAGSRLESQLMYYCARVFALVGVASGDLTGVLRRLRDLERSDLVISSVENVGLPLLLTRCLGLWSSPFAYISIGLPERLVGMHTLFRELFREQLQNAVCLCCFGSEERDLLDQFVNEKSQRTPVIHWTYGVSLPVRSQKESDGQKLEASWDFISVGADPMRDFGSVIGLARELPDRRFLIVASRDFSDMLACVPSNVECVFDLPLEELMERIVAAKLVLLPILPNSYSGAVTTAFLAMALERPVLLSRVGAISGRYQFVHGENCLLVEPQSLEELKLTVNSVMDQEDELKRIARQGRMLVEQKYSLEQLEAQVLKMVGTMVPIIEKKQV